MRDKKLHDLSMDIGESNLYSLTNVHME